MPILSVEACSSLELRVLERQVMSWLKPRFNFLFVRTMMHECKTSFIQGKNHRCQETPNKRRHRLMLAHMSGDDPVGVVIVKRSRKLSNDTDAYDGFRRGMFEHIPDFVKTSFLESVNASGVDHRQRVTLLALRM